MDIGTSVAVASFILGIVAIIFKIIDRNEKIQTPRSGHCEDHSGVCSTLESLTDWLNKIEGKLDRVIERRQ
jgi:hypothetical protein